jgi:hypothetical protein
MPPLLGRRHPRILGGALPSPKRNFNASIWLRLTALGKRGVIAEKT